MESRLYLLPFDHRRSFIELIQAKQPLMLSDKKKLIQYKQIIYSAFKLALTKGISKRQSGILVDETYGKNIFGDAQKNGFITCYPLEKSGQKEFFLERNDYKERLRLFKPRYAKVLIRYNPNGDKALNKRQAEKLALLSSYLKKQSINLLLELLVPPTVSQLKKTSLKQYEQKLRPRLTVKAIQQLQAAGVTPNVWKLEGMDNLKDWKTVNKQINQDHKARIIILGRGENVNKIKLWLKVGAKVKTIIGFAIGRTVFQKPLLDYQNKKINKQQAINKIMNNYFQFIKLFEKEKVRLS